jgi:hypothetical protein
MLKHWTGTCTALCMHGDGYERAYTPLTQQQADDVQRDILQHVVDIADDLMLGATTNALEGLHGVVGRSAPKAFDFGRNYAL